MKQFLEAVGYKWEDRGFDLWCGHGKILFIYSFRTYYGVGIDSVSKGYESQGWLFGVQATGMKD